MKIGKTLWFGRVLITKNCPGNVTTYQDRRTVSTSVERGEHMIVIHDNRTETKEKRQIVLGPALLEIKKGVYNDSFKGRFMYLSDFPKANKEKIKLKMLLGETTIRIERDGQYLDVLDDIIA